MKPGRGGGPLIIMFEGRGTRGRTHSSDQLLPLHHVHNLKSNVLPTAGLGLLGAGSEVRAADHIGVLNQ